MRRRAFEKIPDLVKERVGAVLTENTDLVMKCSTTITSTSSTLKNLYIGTQYHSLYSTNIYSDQTEKMDRLFKTYITPQLKEIYHPVILQEWKLNIDAKEYEKNMLLCHVPSTKKRINRIENFEHWPESIKTIIQWFTFLDIMEYTGNDMISDIPLTTSLLKMFSMFRVKITVRYDMWMKCL